MKGIAWIITFICFGIAALATPVTIIYAIYQWAVIDAVLKIAIWEAAKMWMSCIALIIPGFISFVIASN